MFGVRLEERKQPETTTPDLNVRVLFVLIDPITLKLIRHYLDLDVFLFDILF